MDDIANRRPSALRKTVEAVDRISKICGWLGAPLPFICAFIILYEIIMRTIFESPTPWVAETTAMLCAACYFLGGAWNIKIDGHIRVDIIYSRLSPRVRAGFSCLNFAFFALYIGFMLRVIWPYMVQSIQLNESSYTFWNPLMWPLKIVMFIGFALVMLQGLANFGRDLHFLITGREL
jgi:TRAP-type mannitol/chloroaromatic compound transport system permease small subunit